MPLASNRAEPVTIVGEWTFPDRASGYITIKGQLTKSGVDQLRAMYAAQVPNRLMGVSINSDGDAV